MSRKKNGKKQVYQTIARHRIQYLFSLAEAEALKGKLHHADRYVLLARKLSMKYLVPIPREYATRFCKQCYCYHVPLRTCRVRVQRGMIITYCRNCHSYTRMPLHRHVSRLNRS